jgi:hypothetical protein
MNPGIAPMSLRLLILDHPRIRMIFEHPVIALEVASRGHPHRHGTTAPTAPSSEQKPSEQKPSEQKPSGQEQGNEADT